MCPKESSQDGERPWGQDLWGVAVVTWLAQPGEGEHEGEISWQPSASLRGPVEGQVLISLWWPVIEHKNRMNLHQGKFNWTLGEGSSPRGLSVTGTGSPGEHSQHQDCQSSNCIWMMASHNFVFRCPARTRELDSMMLMGPFQPGMFYDLWS